ncbi:hypothetical protein [Xylanibacter muris]|uniref:Uncharacterized protein n=1 Tax=Xylanibacter muris TaxID=2736290 RepID=A0ABX2AQ52_9BACT|nr:hypothetical protein [Xylanibacter muris]NPD92339.1 hypothetical protein [Xylanibacter muris]
MRDRLSELRSSLKRLSPEQLKEIVRQMETLDKELWDRNPIKAFLRSWKELVNAENPDDKAKAITKLGESLDRIAQKIGDLNSGFSELYGMLGNLGINTDGLEKVSGALNGL